MPTSSFSSFPSSFSTFPELEPRPTSGQPTSDRSRDKKRKEGASYSNEDRLTKNDRSRSREKDQERGRARARYEKKGKERHYHRSRGEQGEDKTKKRNRERKSKPKRRLRDDKGTSKLRAQSPTLGEKEREYKVDLDLKTHDDSYRIFFADTKGDPLTLQYGGIYAGDVPRYRLHHGGRQILGLSSSWTVFRKAGKGIEVGLKGTHKLSALSSSSAHSLLALPPKKISPLASSSKYEEIDGVIQFSSRGRRKDPENSYRSITTLRDSRSDSETSTSSITSDDSEDECSDSSLTLTSQQVTMKNLEKEITENPAAVDKWLTLLSYSLSTIPIMSRNATKARSEITESVLSRALLAHPKNCSSKLLLLRYMKAGEEIWQDTKVRAEWEDVLKIGGTEIWMEWLEWRIRSCAKDIDALLNDVSRTYSALNSDKGEAGELAKLRVFWRMAVIYKEAGFTEKAMAMFQAQVELTFKCPVHLKDVSSETRLSELEEFWESEAPRVGEEGAQGWAKWHDSGKPDPPAMANKTRLKENAEQTTQLDPYRHWSFYETQQDRSSILPARSSEALAEVDPYATVLFSDIRHFLFEVKHLGTGFALRLAWLSFLGLHVPGFATSLSNHLDPNWDDRWNTGYLTTQSHLDAIFPPESDQRVVMTESAAGVLVGREKAYVNTLRIPVREWGKGVIGCLDILPNASKGLRSWWNEDVDVIDVAVVRSAFAQLRMGNRDFEWDEMALGFESAVDSKNSLKLSKSLLSTAQDSLLRWGAHAQLERMRGRLDDARKVYQTVLVLSNPSITADGAAILWYHWAELEWLAEKDEEVISIILRSVDVENAISGVSVLRAKRKLEDAAQSLAAASARDVVKMKERESLVKMQALLEVLTRKDLTAMLQVFDRHLLPGNAPVAARESMIVASLVMLYRYGFILKNPMPPTILRHRASVALGEFPSNSAILGIFLEGEKGQGVWGKVRGMLGDNEMDMSKVKDVSRRVEEVWVASWEKGRWRGEIERTRSGLAGAVERERTRASSVIWRIYLEFEIRTGDLKKAKKLLYRAIGECPFSKGLYMLAFGALRSVFTVQELNSLADLMVERRLRLRKGLDEVLDGWDLQGLEEQTEILGEGESELEHRAEELRRLMPY